MSLQDLIAAGPTVVRNKIDHHLGSMDGETRRLAEKVLRDRGYAASAVARALTADDYPVSATTVKEWRAANGVRA